MTRRAFIPAMLAGFVPPFLARPAEPPEQAPHPDARRCIIGGTNMEAWIISQGAFADYASLDCLYAKGFGGKLVPTDGAVLVRIT